MTLCHFEMRHRKQLPWPMQPSFLPAHLAHLINQLKVSAVSSCLVQSLHLTAMAVE